MEHLNNLFLSTNYKVFNVLACRKRPIQSNYQEVATKKCFCRLLEKYLGTNAGLWSSVYLRFWILENFFEEFCDAWVLRNYFY